jgi:hypothetical protein
VYRHTTLRLMEQLTNSVIRGDASLDTGVEIPEPSVAESASTTR